jgi:hypothetical protein
MDMKRFFLQILYLNEHGLTPAFSAKGQIILTRKYLSRIKPVQHKDLQHHHPSPDSGRLKRS